PVGVGDPERTGDRGADQRGDDTDDHREPDRDVLAPGDDHPPQHADDETDDDRGDDSGDMHIAVPFLPVSEWCASVVPAIRWSMSVRSISSANLHRGRAGAARRTVARMATGLEELTSRLRDFAAARDWERFHTPKNLAMALAGEAGELLAELQWLTPEES